MYVKDQDSHRLVRWVAVPMAHRPMPKPDPAGRLFPVESTPASKTSPQSSGPKSIHEPRNARDYWEIILCVLVIAATLFVAWRIAQIIWLRSEQSQHKTSVNPMPANATTPASSQSTRKSASSDVHSPSPQAAPHSAKSGLDQASNDPVVIQAIVGTDGKVKNAKVLRGNSRLAPAALETVRQLSFNPYTRDGTAVEFETEVVVSQPGTHKNPNENLQISIPQQGATQQTSAH